MLTPTSTLLYPSLCWNDARWSAQKAKDRYKDHLVDGKLTRYQLTLNKSHRRRHRLSLKTTDHKICWHQLFRWTTNWAPTWAARARGKHLKPPYKGVFCFTIELKWLTLRIFQGSKNESTRQSSTGSFRWKKKNSSNSRKTTWRTWHKNSNNTNNCKNACWQETTCRTWPTSQLLWSNSQTQYWHKRLLPGKKKWSVKRKNIIEYHFKLHVFENLSITRWNREGKHSNNSLRGSPEQPTLSQGASLIPL